MDIEDIKKQLKEYEKRKTGFIAEQYHKMLEQFPKEMQDHIHECTPCRRLSQQTVTKVFELINNHFLTLLEHMKKND